MYSNKGYKLFFENLDYFENLFTWSKKRTFTFNWPSEWIKETVNIYFMGQSLERTVNTFFCNSKSLKINDELKVIKSTPIPDTIYSEVECSLEKE